jgi:cob(I)alamin adenosyltransferase
MRLVSFQEQEFFNDLQKLQFKLLKITEAAAMMQAKSEIFKTDTETIVNYDNAIENANQIIQQLREFFPPTDSRRKTFEGIDRFELLEKQKERLNTSN